MMYSDYWIRISGVYLDTLLDQAWTYIEEKISSADTIYGNDGNIILRLRLRHRRSLFKTDKYKYHTWFTLPEAIKQAVVAGCTRGCHIGMTNTDAVSGH